MLNPFHIHEAVDAGHAVQLMLEFGDSAAFYAGGTELLVALKEGFLSLDHLIDVKRIRELGTLDRDQEHLSIGSCVAYSALIKNGFVGTLFPALVDLLDRIANPRVRTAGTMGGNLAFAEPHSDVATILSALGSEVECAGASETRAVPVAEFFVGPYESVLKREELVTRVRIPIRPDSITRFQRLCFYERPTANACVSISTDDEHVSAAAIATGASGPYPVRYPRIEAALVGLEPTEVRAAAPQLLEDLQENLEVMDDAYGSSDYKRHLTAELTRRALDAVLTEFEEQRG